MIALSAGIITNLSIISSFVCNTFALECRDIYETQLKQAFKRLNSDVLNTRLKGIESVERVLRNDDNFNREILEELAYFVRKRAPWKENFTRDSIDEDVQKALTVISRIPKLDSQGNYYSLDLTKIDISGAKLENGNFEGAIMWGSNLRGVLLNSANLKNTDLGGVDLTNASLERANLEGSALWCSDVIQPIRCSIFDGARMYETNLKRANLAGANLIGAIGLTKDQIMQAELCNTTLGDGNVSYRDCD
jgi:uncharacterized protein YjbI with pentapeptide repeats